MGDFAMEMLNQNLFDSCNQILAAKFNGVIKLGKHDNYSTRDGSHECCVLELYSIVLNKSWTDDPNILRIFDIRAINDINVPDSLRTEWMLKLLCAYEGSLDWPGKKQKEVVSKIVILTINRLISNLPGLDENIRNKCKNAKTLEEAKFAAAAAAYAAAADYAADYAAASAAADYAAASATDYAIDFAAAAAVAAADYVANKEEIFVEICKLWLEAAV